MQPFAAASLQKSRTHRRSPLGACFGAPAAAVTPRNSFANCLTYANRDLRGSRLSYDHQSRPADQVALRVNVTRIFRYEMVTLWILKRGWAQLGSNQ